VSFIRTGLREIGLKIRRQRTRMVLRHEKRLLQRSEIALGREGTSQAANFPELRNEIVALKKLEQEQKEVALRIAQIEEGIKNIEAQRTVNVKEQSAAMSKLDAEKKPILQRRNDAKNAAELCEREVNAVERRIQENDAAGRSSRSEAASSSRRRAKKSGLPEHWPPSRGPGNRAAKRAPSARTRSKTSCRGGSLSETHCRTRASLQPDRQARVAAI